MAGIASLTDLVTRIGTQHTAVQTVYANLATGGVNSFMSGLKNQGTMGRIGHTAALPSLPSGVASYIPLSMMIACSASGAIIVGKLIDMGSFDISGSGTFTDGSAMPTVTELGVSRAIPTALIAEVTTAISFSVTTPSISVTYTDQDGNSSTSPNLTIPNACPVGQVGFGTLATGDFGLTDITNCTRVGSPTTPVGVIKFWGMIPLAIMSNLNSVNSTLCSESLITGGSMSVQRYGAGDVLGIFHFGVQSIRSGVGVISFVGDTA